MTICPTGALHRESAVAPVLLEEQLCIGCRMCIMACPFGAIGLYLHGEKGAIVKCDLCQGDPQCVRFCEPSALKFVRRDQVGSAKRDAVVDAYLASVKTVEAGG
jgi:Fe-S-cluster-containing hydrogenase component 2